MFALGMRHHKMREQQERERQKAALIKRKKLLANAQSESIESSDQQQLHVSKSATPPSTSPAKVAPKAAADDAAELEAILAQIQLAEQRQNSADQTPEAESRLGVKDHCNTAGAVLSSERSPKSSADGHRKRDSNGDGDENESKSNTPSKKNGYHQK